MVGKVWQVCVDGDLITAAGTAGWRFVMQLQGIRSVMVAALALFLGIAASAWSQLADPMAEDYTAHVIPFYKIDANWSAFLVVADTSFHDLAEGGTPIELTFYDAACNLVSDARVELTTADAQFFALHDPNDAQGQFNGIPSEGVVLLNGAGHRFLTYILLANGNNNSLIRIDSIPCQGPQGGPCTRGAGNGTWLRYDAHNTVAATFGDSGAFRTNLYFFSARGDLRAELLQYGKPRHGEWAGSLHLDGYCDEVYLGSRRLDLACTKRVSLGALNFTFLNVFPNDHCAGKPGHLETYASDNGVDAVAKDYSGFQETIACLVPPTNLIGTGYMHHAGPGPVTPPVTAGCPSGLCN
jgi:hypothetical protein